MMPMPGAKPKPEGTTVHRNPTAEWTEVEDVPYRGKKPGLPSKLKYVVSGAALEIPMPAQTRTWWRRVSAMPHCVLWTETDWQFALDTAFVHAAFMLGDTVRAAELRVREKQMGTTLDSRRDLRIRYVPPKAEEAAAPAADPQVSSFEDARRKRLTGAS